MIRVVLADDQQVVRTGLHTILDTAPDIEVVGEAADGHAAVELVLSLDPDVVVMDIQMPRMTGLEATAELARRNARAKVLVLTTFALDENLMDAFRLGAAGFIAKTSEPDAIVAAVRTVADGSALVGPELTHALLDAFATPRSRPSPELARLTDREREILGLVAEGLSNAEISRRLYIGAGTVKTHVSRVLAKIGARDRVQAVVFAYEYGVVRPNGSGGPLRDPS